MLKRQLHKYMRKKKTEITTQFDLLLSVIFFGLSWWEVTAQHSWRRFLSGCHSWHERARGKECMVGIKFAQGAALQFNSFQFPTVKGFFTNATSKWDLWFYDPSSIAPAQDAQILPSTWCALPYFFSRGLKLNDCKDSNTKSSCQSSCRVNKYMSS